MSTNNSFYRYEIESLADISETVYARRKLKADQNNKTGFLFVFYENFKAIDLAAVFIATKICAQDLVQTTPRNHHLICNRINRLQCLLNLRNPADLKALPEFDTPALKPENLLLTPLTTTDLNTFAEFNSRFADDYSIYWLFAPYNPEIRNSLTVKDVSTKNIKYRTIKGLEIYNSNIPQHYELEPLKPTSYKIEWTFTAGTKKPLISVIIPTYNNVIFLSNVIGHLLQQNASRETYEIIIADDGSHDNSSEIIFSLFESYKAAVNLKYVYWSKLHPIRGDQKFFRPGLARNLAARYSKGEYLLFLDSDMLTPADFISSALLQLQENDVIQYQRFHINQELSKTNPVYGDIDLKRDTYIEEKEYWSEFFFSENWSALPHFWKYTCTYSLGISKEKFFELGLFKKYYVSYGFEDTDLGYEAYKRNFRFQLIKIPLLHLTAYDMMQYQNSFTKRFSLLSKTAELFYLQHLDSEIYQLLGNYFRFQKPFRAFLKDLF